MEEMAPRRGQRIECGTTVYLDSEGIGTRKWVGSRLLA